MENNYNDGIVYIYKRKNIVNSFKAQINATKNQDLEYISKFFYKEETQRQQDVVFADAMDKQLSLKISIPYVNSIDNGYVVKIDNYLYSIFHSDADRKKGKIYIYLEGMREFER